MTCLPKGVIFLTYLKLRKAVKNRQLTFNQYRIADLTMFTAFFTISETIVTLAANKWFPAQPYAFSLSVLFLSLVLMRWGLLAAIPAIAGAIAFCVSSSAEAEHYLIYITGNLFTLIAYAYIKFRGKEKVKEDPFRSFLFVIMVFVLMQTGRWLASLPFGNGAGAFIEFITTDSLSLLFAMIAMYPARRIDGLFEDQKAYLFRLEREKQERKGF